MGKKMKNGCRVTEIAFNKMMDRYKKTLDAGELIKVRHELNELNFKNTKS